ncbi:hypothetical protein [Nodularia sphaerocarpa]|uniref:hypothetical protein n=1 Tax=Nodularia sphaerocarpa TaxID=137816 RepID=UPI001EFAACBA|nr:hypothetical protein [Nodularia sphaerocarpa]MDB9376103.1 hypothetical protein [Nodularia sphaerocarpa CS-585]ULP72025.1 hypothetical protein BDGGKGIB_01662 [Nodularia sphaerocarpa UHCC 0038]
MKNNAQKTTTPQPLNCQKMPLFEPLNLEQQDSVVGGLFLQSIFDTLPGDIFIPGRAEAEAAAAAAELATAEVEAEAMQYSIFFPFDFSFNLI